MRKLTVFTLVLTLLLSIAVAGNAAEDAMTLSASTFAPGQMVYITASLTEEVKGDAIGVTYTYDPTVLTPQPAYHSWTKEGVLEDFNNNDSGVWAADGPVDLKGSVCTLAFSVPAGAVLTETTVSCQLIVKNSSTDVGTYNAQLTLTYTPVCSHEYDDWADAGLQGHSHSCKLCGYKETQSHAWDDGVTGTPPEDSSVRRTTYTCTICGGEKVFDMKVEGSGDQWSNLPETFVPETQAPTTVTIPPETQEDDHYEPTSPEFPVEAPTETTAPEQPGDDDHVHQPEQPGNNDQTQPEQPTEEVDDEYKFGDEQTGSNRPESGNQNESHDGHDHEIEAAPQPDDHDHDHEEQIVIEPQPDDHDHEHEVVAEPDDHEGHNHEELQSVPSKKDQSITAVLLLVVAGAGVAAAMYYVKKKH